MTDTSTEQTAAKGSGGLPSVAWLPDLLYTNGRFESGVALVGDASGRILSVTRAASVEADRIIHLRNRALLPGLVNAHSHAFQRVIRGRTEHRTGKRSDDFWTWREMMYAAAARLTPQDIYDASRMTFLEMALGGVTAVGEFHYLHNAPDGTPYDDPNLLSKEVIRAARDSGLRIALLRVAYARSGFRSPPNEKQARFIEPVPDIYLRNVENLKAELDGDGPQSAWVGLAPHSVRAVPLTYLREIFEYAKAQGLPTHMHIAEQPAEIEACMEEYGRRPVALLETEGLLDERFTGIHGIHITAEEARMLARSRAMICACPTTERNLGDGVVPADLLFEEGVRISLGTDSHTQIDLLEDARELEYNMRLNKLQRVVLHPTGDSPSALAASLFDCASLHGAESIGFEGGTLQPGYPSDFFTIDLDDPSVAGATPDDLLAHIIFSLSLTAVRDVYVGGGAVVREGRHKSQCEIIERFVALQKRLWS